MKKITKPLTFVLCAVLLLSVFSACGNAEPTATPTPSGTKVAFSEPALAFEASDSLSVLLFSCDDFGSFTVSKADYKIDLASKTIVGTKPVNENLITIALSFVESLDGKTIVGVIVYYWQPYFVTEENGTFSLHRLGEGKTDLEYSAFCRQVYDFSISESKPTGGFGL